MVKLDIVFLIVKKYTVRDKTMDFLVKTFILSTLCTLLILPVTIIGIVPDVLHLSNEAFGKT